MFKDYTGIKTTKTKMILLAHIIVTAIPTFLNIVLSITLYCMGFET